MEASQVNTDLSVQWINRWSQSLRWISTVLGLMVPVGVAWTWSHFEQLATYLPSTAGIPYDPANITTFILMSAFSLNMLPGVIAMYGFWQLRILFGLFSSGIYFDNKVITRVRNFALAIMIYGIAAPVSRFIIGMLISTSNPPGERVLLLRISSDDLVIVFLGAVFFVIARVWGKAKDIADENAQIV